MTVAEPPDITRLIEEGLTKYGAGDLDGALLAWEQALAVDPDNAQASSYVDYVRANYEVLVAGGNGAGDPAPFAIDDEPEYHVEIVPGQVVPVSASPMYFDPLDGGWDIDSEAPATARSAPAVRTSRTTSGSLAYEMDADEPDETAPRDRDISFDDATREYPGGAGHPPALLTVPAEPPSDFQAEEATGGFSGSQHTPLGFTTQTTDVRKRDLGFVQPVAPAGEAASSDVHVNVRTPTKPRVDPSVAPRPPAPPANEHAPMLATAPTVDFETHPITPHVDPRSETRELPPSAVEAFKPTLSTSTTQRIPELNRSPTAPGVAPPRATQDDPLLAAPTREIPQRASSTLSDDDQKTGEADARAIRASIAAQGMDREGTRHDVVLPFDPIDARSAQILDEVDAGAPADETKDDRVRRRITGLVERALGWNGIGELDRAVAAVDLALSEDPANALAQKLVHRNRDTIMAVFQNFLGDLSRQPQLAKPLHELSNAPISPRAAFLLSRVDGSLSIDEILDVSGMPRMEAYRYLSQLYLRGILK